MCVGAALGNVWDWGNFSVILFVRDVPLLGPASLVRSVSGVAAPGREFESLQPLCRTAGREVRAKGKVHSNTGTPQETWGDSDSRGLSEPRVAWGWGVWLPSVACGQPE